MACCLTAPSHYLNQCWLTFSKVQWHSAEIVHPSITKISFTINCLKFYSNLPVANELNVQTALPKKAAVISAYLTTCWVLIRAYHYTTWSMIMAAVSSLLMHWRYCSVAPSNKYMIWVRSQNCGCLVTWFCYQLIAKPGNKTATVSWSDPYIGDMICGITCLLFSDSFMFVAQWMRPSPSWSLWFANSHWFFHGDCFSQSCKKPSC